MQIEDKDFNTLVTYMQSNYGIDLSRKRLLIESRLGVHIKKLGFTSFASFVEYAINDNTRKAVDLLTSKLTTNYTFFMREGEHYEFLMNNVLPVYKKQLEKKDIRIWSAGCSSGEEAYTIAMTINEYFGKETSLWDTKILATDISDAMLQSAKLGLYPASNLERLPKSWIDKYFTEESNGIYQVKDIVKNEVIFRYFNLSDTFPFRNKFHIIFCRNVMIYFNKETKVNLVDKFYNHLEEGGYLFIGHSESLNGISNAFTYVKPSIYRKGFTR